MPKTLVQRYLFFVGKYHDVEIPERHGKRVNTILDVCFFKIGILMDLEIIELTHGNILVAAVTTLMCCLIRQLNTFFCILGANYMNILNIFV